MVAALVGMAITDITMIRATIAVVTGEIAAAMVVVTVVTVVEGMVAAAVTDDGFSKALSCLAGHLR